MESWKKWGIVGVVIVLIAVIVGMWINTPTKYNFEYESKNTFIGEESIFIEDETYVDIWKEVLMQSNGMDEVYFDNHIEIEYAGIGNFNRDGISVSDFLVSYYHVVDWARMYRTDRFTISREGVGDGISAEELLRDIDPNIYESKYGLVNIGDIDPVTSISSKDKIKKAVKEASPELKFDVNSGLKNGLELLLYGTIDLEMNKCIYSSINIETAEVSDIKNGVCFVT